MLKHYPNSLNHNKLLNVTYQSKFVAKATTNKPKVLLSTANLKNKNNIKPYKNRKGKYFPLLLRIKNVNVIIPKVSILDINRRKIIRAMLTARPFAFRLGHVTTHRKNFNLVSYFLLTYCFRIITQENSERGWNNVLNEKKIFKMLPITTIEDFEKQNYLPVIPVFRSRTLFKAILYYSLRFATRRKRLKFRAVTYKNTPELKEKKKELKIKTKIATIKASRNYRLKKIQKMYGEPNTAMKMVKSSRRYMQRFRLFKRQKVALSSLKIARKKMIARYNWRVSKLSRSLRYIKNNVKHDRRVKYIKNIKSFLLNPDSKKVKRPEKFEKFINIPKKIYPRKSYSATKYSLKYKKISPDRTLSFHFNNFFFRLILGSKNFNLTNKLIVKLQFYINLYTSFLKLRITNRARVLTTPTFPARYYNRKNRFKRFIMEEKIKKDPTLLSLSADKYQVSMRFFKKSVYLTLSNSKGHPLFIGCGRIIGGKKKTSRAKSFRNNTMAIKALITKLGRWMRGNRIDVIESFYVRASVNYFKVKISVTRILRGIYRIHINNFVILITRPHNNINAYSFSKWRRL